MPFTSSFANSDLTPDGSTDLHADHDRAGDRGDGAENAVGHYTSFNYFQSVDTPENKAFVERFKAKYGANSVTNAVMEAAYFSAYFLAQALEKVKSTDADASDF